MATAPTLVSHYVFPSGVARDTYSAAMAPFAPGLLSTITCRPSSLPSASAMARATKSSVPPGGKPTTSRVTFCCAYATTGSADSNAAIANARQVPEIVPTGGLLRFGNADQRHADRENMRGACQPGVIGSRGAAWPDDRATWPPSTFMIRP